MPGWGPHFSRHHTDFIAIDESCRKAEAKGTNFSTFSSLLYFLSVASKGVTVHITPIVASVHHALLITWKNCWSTSLGLCKSFTEYLIPKVIFGIIICKTDPQDPIPGASALADLTNKPAQWPCVENTDVVLDYGYQFS